MRNIAESASWSSIVLDTRTLTPGHQIHWYRIESVLGQGGFGVTYLAHDTNLDRRVAIKEYLPTLFAARDVDDSVRPLSDSRRDDFDWGLNNFLAEAKTLARFRHENIVGVHSVFEENSTAYMVMAYEQGDSLSSLYRRGEYRDQVSLERVFFPIFDGLGEIHRLGFVHRDIKPANIYIREDGSAVLLDFGAARLMQQQQTGEMTSLVSQGYTPLEQYSTGYGEQGAWTDVYALAATMYEGVTGSRPEESLSRSACLLRRRPDPIMALTSDAYPGFDARFLDAVITGLGLQPEERPNDLVAWLARFQDDGAAASSNSDFDEFADLDALDGLDDATRLQLRVPVPDEDRTRLRNPVAVPSVPRRTETVSGLSTPGRAERPLPHSGLPDFDMDDDLAPPTYRVPVAKADGQEEASNREPRRARSSRHVGHRSGAPWILIAALSLAAVGMGTWWGLGKLWRESGDDMPSPALVEALPAPNGSRTVTSFDEEVLGRLDAMSQLAALYRQVEAASPDGSSDPTLVSSARALRQELGNIAEDWHPARYAGIVGRIEQTLAVLPESVAERAALQATIASADDRSDLDTTRALLDSSAIVEPAGSALIDRIGQLGSAEYRELADSAAWSNMMARLGHAALERARESDFDGASRLVRAGLTLTPDDVFMRRLGEHLRGSQIR